MKKSFLFTLGCALFAMFFGAGNLVIPLKIGLNSQSGFLWALTGFSFTGVLAPLLGFVAMMLYSGDWRSFFASIGKIPGFLFLSTVLLVLGPCGGLARCIALSSSAVQTVFPDLTLEIFSFCACICIFLLTCRETNVIEIIGKFLSPIKLVTLGALLLLGLMYGNTISGQAHEKTSLIYEGMTCGLQTLDLPAALLFSAFLYPALEKFVKGKLISITYAATIVAIICGSMLAIVYFGFGYVAATQQYALSEVPTELLLISLSEQLLGPYGAKFTMILIVLACLTTEVALTAIFADFLKKEILRNTVRYEVSVFITCVWSYFFAIMSFSGIISILAPVLIVSYPLLTALCIFNIVKKLWWTSKVEREETTESYAL